MNLIELQRSLRQLRLGGMANVLETRLRQAQAEPMAPIDLLSILIADELTRRSDRLLERRRKHAAFRDPDKTLDNFDFAFNPKMNRSLVFDLAACGFIDRREDALFLGPGGTGKSHLAQAIGQAAILQGHRVLYRETHLLLEELGEATIDGTRKQYMESVSTVALLIIDKCEVVTNVELAHGRPGNRPPHRCHRHISWRLERLWRARDRAVFCSIRVRD
jgi:DNA replication protein DnaC